MNRALRGIPEVINAELFLRKSINETPFWQILKCPEDSLIIVTQGFEERSLGILEGMAKHGMRTRLAIIGRYPNDEEGLNNVYQERLRVAADRVSILKPLIVEIGPDETWIVDALQEANGLSNVIVDITTLSNRNIFPTLDALTRAKVPVLISYTEAKEYWPTKMAWKRLRNKLDPSADIGEEVDRKPWLFSQDHEIQFVAGHEGFETAAEGRALIGFLPFKCARLAAIISDIDFSSSVFVAGKPRLAENYWRLEAIKQINAQIISRWRVVEMNTFGYRDAFQELFQLLSAEDCSLLRYNIHIAILGSKLQNVACWVLSRIIPEITLISSVPSKYYREAFSNGIGLSWGFPLIDPCSSNTPDRRDI